MTVAVNTRRPPQPARRLAAKDDRSVGLCGGAAV